MKKEVIDKNIRTRTMLQEHTLDQHIIIILQMMRSPSVICPLSISVYEHLPQQISHHIRVAFEQGFQVRFAVVQERREISLKGFGRCVFVGDILV